MPISLTRRFGEHLRQLRQERELTQEGLAERSDLSVDAIRRMERGVFSPSLNTLSKLCEGLGLSLRTLFASFDGDRRSDVAQVADYLAQRNARDVKRAWRVLRALFEGD